MSSSHSVRFAPEAEDDLRAIIHFTREMWGASQEQAYSNALDTAFGSIRKFSGLGRIQPDFGSEVRSYLSGQHVIFYRSHDEIVEILRILHVRMDSESYDI